MPYNYRILNLVLFIINQAQLCDKQLETRKHASYGNPVSVTGPPLHRKCFIKPSQKIEQKVSIEVIVLHQILGIIIPQFKFSSQTNVKNILTSIIESSYVNLMIVLKFYKECCGKKEKADKKV